MEYYSTNNSTIRVDFREATMNGLATDKGLYFPETIPVMDQDFIFGMDKLSREEIAFHVIHPFVGSSISIPSLEKIVSDTINFDFPLIELNDTISVLELFHGPTLAFKDVGARFMSRCLGYFAGSSNRKITVLVATSGDTGGAVAHAFHGVPGVDVVILYPSGKVSTIQELQLTTLGQNISALEIAGSFDDCQQLVKQAFADTELKAQLFLTSANSINVARWLPQQFYYFFAWQQWKNKNEPPVISVPSGNFGNICAGLLAYRSGLPVRHFVAACNANDTVPEYFRTGKYTPKKSVSTMSNAMDVGDPSNFIRMIRLFEKEAVSLRNILTTYSISDEATTEGISRLYKENGYLTDPHGAVGYKALEMFLQSHPGEKGFFLETAHPVKFYDVVEPIIQNKVGLPKSIQSLMHQKKASLRMKVDFTQLKNYLMSTR